MRAEMLLVAGALAVIGSCDPPDPDSPYCRFGPYTLGMQAVRSRADSLEAKSLARVAPLPRQAPSWTPPPAGKIEQEFWRSPYNIQRVRMGTALVQALLLSPAQIEGLGRWQGSDQVFDPSGFQWQGLRLLPAPLAAGELRRQVQELHALTLPADDLDFASKGPERHLAAWTLLGRLGLAAVPSLKDYSYTLTLIELVDEAALEPEHMLKRHFQVPRPFTKGVWGQEVTPVLPMPASLSFPAGHATHATAIAALLGALGALGALGGGDAVTLMADAERVAERRRLGRLHTRADNESGAQLGRMIAAAILAEASRTDGPLRALCRRVTEELSARHAVAR